MSTKTLFKKGNSALDAAGNLCIACNGNQIELDVSKIIGSTIDITTLEARVTFAEEDIEDLEECVNGFMFRVDEDTGVKQVSVDEGETWENFNSGGNTPFESFEFTTDASGRCQTTLSVGSDDYFVYDHLFVLTDGVNRQKVIDKFDDVNPNNVSTQNGKLLFYNLSAATTYTCYYMSRYYS